MTQPVLRNCYLPEWMHHAANGAVSGLVGVGAALIAVRYFGAPLWVFWLGAITAIGGLLLPRPFSLVEGCAGEVGYEELDSPSEQETDI